MEYTLEKNNLIRRYNRCKQKLDLLDLIRYW